MIIKYKHGLGIQIFLLLMLIFFSQSAWAQKTDIVYLKNGDRITGEVKSMGRGKLELSTDHMGTLFIEWEQILQLTSNTSQAVELTNGQRFYGSLEKSEDENTVVVNTPIGPANLNGRMRLNFRRFIGSLRVTIIIAPRHNAGEIATVQNAG